METPGAGATWRRLDLHLHSPTILGFVPPKGRKRENGIGLSDAYVEQLARQEISVAAITDYNEVNIEWFEITAAKAVNRGITLLPGVEMTFREGRSDLHILGIFPADTRLERLNVFLQSMDKSPTDPLLDNKGSHRPIDLKISLTDALRDLRSQFNCLLVFPHPDRANGLFKSLTPEAAARLLMEIQADAIEDCSQNETIKLQSTGVLSPGFLDQLAFVEFSNPKRIEEIGKQYRTDGTLRATYLKLSSTDLDAVRMALHSPQTRLSLTRIPPAVHPRIRSMVISGSGFLGNLSISWNPDLNVIIGDKGSGKSAIIESLRYAFGLPSCSNQSIRDGLVRHALGTGGEVQVILDGPLREGKPCQYRIVRVWGEEPRVFQINPEKSLPVSPSEVLGHAGMPAIFGQREIDTVSGSEQYTLAFFDELIGEEARQCQDALAKSMESLTANAGAIPDMRARLAKREGYVRQLQEIENEIETQEKKATERRGQVTDLPIVLERLQNAAEVVEGTLEDYDKWRSALLNSLGAADRDLRGAQSPHAAILQEGAKVLGVLQESMKVVLDDQRTLFEQALQSLTRIDMRCKETLQLQGQDGKRIEGDPQTEPLVQDRFRRSAKERELLMSLVGELDEIDDHLKAFRQKRQGLLQHARACRSRQTRLRRERADLIAKSLKGRLDLQMEAGAQKGSYEKQLSLLLKGSNLSQEAIEQLAVSEETDGIAIAEAARGGSKDVQSRFGLKPEMADRLVQWLTDEESRLFELEALAPQDVLRLKLGIEGEHRSRDHLAKTRDAAALLFLMFGLESRMILIDQPDEYLNDPLVHRQILQMLRERKWVRDQSRRHQIILTTNDPTIPMMGDAELVIPLQARDDRVHIIAQGSIDDRSIREHIKTLIQGGEEAFQKGVDTFKRLIPS